MTISPLPLILLVEDEPIVRMVALQGLEDAGFEVIEADSAVDALEILASRTDVGIIFSDVHMPGDLDGLDLAERVTLHWPAIKVVLTSALTPDRPVPKPGQFIEKPYSLGAMTELLTRISSYDK